MKKIFFLSILFLGINYAQTTTLTPTTYNLELYTGDFTTFQFINKADYSAWKLHFVVKANRNIYSTRLIEKKNDVNGGADDQIKVVYANSRYYIYVYIEGSNTDTLLAEYYYYDLTATNASDSSLNKTLYTGAIQFKHQVQSPYDNTYADEGAVFFIPNGTIPNETIIWDIVNQRWVPSGDTITVGGGSGSEFDTTYVYDAIAEKAPVVSPTFSGTVTIPSPFTLGSTSITTTATQFNYLNTLTGNVQIQLNTKEPLINAGTSLQYFRGDKSWATLDKSAVGLSNVTNESKTTMFNNPTFTNSVSLPSVVYINGSQLTVGASDLNYVTGATSNIQEQINNIGVTYFGAFEEDSNGDLMPNDDMLTDTYYELDGNLDIMPK